MPDASFQLEGAPTGDGRRQPRVAGVAVSARLVARLAEVVERLFTSSRERAHALRLWLNHYNYTRPHGSLGHRPPASRLKNVSRNYT